MWMHTVLINHAHTRTHTKKYKKNFLNAKHSRVVQKNQIRHANRRGERFVSRGSSAPILGPLTYTHKLRYMVTKFCMVIKLDEKNIFTGLTTAPALTKNFVTDAADMRSVCGTFLSSALLWRCSMVELFLKSIELCYNKCIKFFFGHRRYDSVTTMPAEIGLLSNSAC